MIATTVKELTNAYSATNAHDNNQAESTGKGRDQSEAKKTLPTFHHRQLPEARASARYPAINQTAAKEDPVLEDNQ